ncbi:single-stranded-DNA-specific exonuclease RecJ [Candidatus Williamhamiltonella defendens]|uniref:single-stranded-DNA-specific exonuclease RecJ n=1 Tax=Candidatus Williamhamiltonella defendens TaxID=138072 RepID=UPI00130EDB0F|nr:single-stranded-DNA-specific exonuclease RecJ [Candidatus Hamiltonella defensa]
MNIKKQLRRREMHHHALSETYPKLIRQLYASRGITTDQQLARGTKSLCDWQALAGIEAAIQILKEAFLWQKRIMIVGDFDVDGATSTALAMLALEAMGAQNVCFLIPNRFKEGYGLTPKIVEQVSLRGADLIITVDNGISSHEGVDLAHHKGMQVLITDHHLPTERLPNADAIINPNQLNCPFPSKSLAGVGVTFYLMLGLRAHLRKEGRFHKKNIQEPNLAEFLDLVALGTVADVVPLDTNNRILVHQGLNRIRAGNSRPGIVALLEVASRGARSLTVTDLGFALAPLLNAAGRLDNMSVGVALLLTKDLSEARELAKELDALNKARREIEQSMQKEALELCHKIECHDQILPQGIALYHHRWHQGVVGILASRIKDRFDRPAIAFAAIENGQLKGSGRSVANIHMRDLLEQLDRAYPGLILKFGGHAMAAGVLIEQNKFDFFRQCFAERVAASLNNVELENSIWSDGELSPDKISLETAQLLRDAGPWGQGFPEPVFDGKFRILQQRLLCGCHLKLQVELIEGGISLDAIAFNVDLKSWPYPPFKQVTLAYKLDINVFRQQPQLQLMIQGIWEDNG